MPIFFLFSILQLNIYTYKELKLNSLFCSLTHLSNSNNFLNHILHIIILIINCDVHSWSSLAGKFLTLCLLMAVLRGRRHYSNLRRWLVIIAMPQFQRRNRRIRVSAGRSTQCKHLQFSLFASCIVFLFF